MITGCPEGSYKLLPGSVGCTSCSFICPHQGTDDWSTCRDKCPNVYLELYNRTSHTISTITDSTTSSSTTREHVHEVRSPTEELKQWVSYVIVLSAVFVIIIIACFVASRSSRRFRRFLQDCSAAFRRCFHDTSVRPHATEGEPPGRDVHPHEDRKPLVDLDHQETPSGNVAVPQYGGVDTKPTDAPINDEQDRSRARSENCVIMTRTGAVWSQTSSQIITENAHSQSERQNRSVDDASINELLDNLGGGTSSMLVPTQVVQSTNLQIPNETPTQVTGSVPNTNCNPVSPVQPSSQRSPSIFPLPAQEEYRSFPAMNRHFQRQLSNPERSIPEPYPGNIPIDDSILIGRYQNMDCSNINVYSPRNAYCPTANPIPENANIMLPQRPQMTGYPHPPVSPNATYKMETGARSFNNLPKYK